MFATKNYEAGDIILEEDPLVSCQFAWNAAYKYIACDHCMRLVIQQFFFTNASLLVRNTI